MCRCPAARSNGAPASSGGGDSARIVSALFRFDQMASRTFVNGATTLVDTQGRALPVTIGNVAAAATFDILLATGLRFVANASNTVYHSGTQSASFIEALFTDLFATYGVDASWDMRVRYHATVVTMPTAMTTGALTLGIRGLGGTPSNGAARMRGILRQATGAGPSQIMAHQTDTSGGQSYVLPTAPSLPDTFGFQHEQGAMRAHSGRWAGDFDSTPMVFDVGDQPATSANTSGYRDTRNILALAFGTGNTLSNVQVTIDQMRIDWRAAA